MQPKQKTQRLLVKWHKYIKTEYEADYGLDAAA